MDNYFLIEVFSLFDINYKYFIISVKNQLNRNYGHFCWLLFSICLFKLLINTFNLLIISDDDIEGLKSFGSFGFVCGGKATRFMMDMTTVSFGILELIALYNYFNDKMQWLLKMSLIYEEIRTKHFDTFLMNCAKKTFILFQIKFDLGDYRL